MDGYNENGGATGKVSPDKKEEYYWEGSCSAISYKPLFTLSRWIIGFFGVIALLIVHLIYSDDGFDDEILPLLITLGVIIAVYLLTVWCKVVVRNKKFTAQFTLMDDAVIMREIRENPKGFVAGFVFLITGLLSFIGSIWLVFANSAVAAGAGEAGANDRELYRSAKYKKIKEITVSENRDRIYLKKGVGRMILLVAPGQCDDIRRRIEGSRNK